MENLSKKEISEAVLAIANMRETLDNFEEVIEGENTETEEIGVQIGYLYDAFEHIRTFGKKHSEKR